MKGINISIFILFLHCNLVAQWSIIDVPDNGEVYDIALVNDYLILSTFDDLLVSKVHSNSWESIHEQNTVVYGIDVLNDTLLYSLVYKADEDSVKLKSINMNNFMYQKISSFPSNYYSSLTCQDSVVLVGGAGGVVYRSDDYGKTWEQFDLPDNYFVNQIIIEDDVMIAGLGFFNNGGVYLSYDHGDSWIISDSSPKDFVTDVSYNKENNLLVASTKSGNVYYSDNWGSVWHEHSFEYNSGFYCLDFTPNNFLITSGSTLMDSTIIFSTDDIESKFDTSKVFDDYGIIVSQLIVSDKLMFFGTDAGKLIKYYDQSSSIYDEINQRSFIYPNPSSEYILIQMPYRAKEFKFGIYNVFGDLEMEYYSERQNVRIDISNLSKGMKVVQIEVPSESKRLPSKSFIKM